MGGKREKLGEVDVRKKHMRKIRVLVAFLVLSPILVVGGWILFLIANFDLWLSSDEKKPI